MNSLPKWEDLGNYHAEAGRIKADLSLTTNLVFLGVISSGTDWYQADVKFYTTPQYQGEIEGFSIAAHFSSNVLSELLGRMKAAESGIEEMLRRGSSLNDNWKEKRDVIKCILSLEEQTKHLYGEREKAARKRNIAVYGERQS